MLLNELKHGCGQLQTKLPCKYHQFEKFVEYFGEFRQDRFDGKGLLETEDYVYLGEFSQGRICGVGFIYQKQRLQSYIGQWRFDEKNGLGTLIDDQGMQLIGTFYDGLKHGLFQLKSQDGKVEYAEFKQDSFVDETQEQKVQPTLREIVAQDFQAQIKRLKSALEQMKIQHKFQLKKLSEFDHIKVQEQIATEKQRLEAELVKIKIHYHGVKIGLKKIVKEVQKIGHQTGYPVQLFNLEKELLLEGAEISALHIIAPVVY